MKTATFALSIFLMATMSSYAQSQSPIETDRPDQTETTSLVPVGRFQGEMGVEHEQTESNGRDFLIPTALLKFGLFEFLELRTVLEFANSQSEDGIEKGLKPLEIGVKVKLFEEKGLLPAASLIAQVKLPKMASPDFKVDHAAPEFRLLLQHTLSDASNLGYNLGARWDGSSTDPEYLYTVSPSYDLSKKVRVFGEAYGFIQSKHHATQWIDGGFSILLSDNFQIDISSGYELTHTAGFHNFFEAAGFSFRI